MTKHRRPFRPSVSDTLEPRVALSTTAAAPIAARCAEVSQGTCPTPTDLNGVLTVTLRITTRGDSTEIQLSGGGQVGSLGGVTVSGTVYQGGITGSADGTLVLSGARGTLTLGLGFTQSSLVQFQWTVVGGTGAYAQATGRGQGHLIVPHPYTPYPVISAELIL